MNALWMIGIGDNRILTTSASFTGDVDKVTFDSTLFNKELKGFHLKQVLSQELGSKITLRAGAEWMNSFTEQTFKSPANTFITGFTNNTLAGFAEAEMYASTKFVAWIGTRVNMTTIWDGLISHREAPWPISLMKQVSFQWPMDGFSRILLIIT